MKSKQYLLIAAGIAALAFSSALAAAEKKTSPAPAASEAAAETTKPPRPAPFKGVATSIDKSAKTFTIVGKKASKVIKVTDKTTVTKAGAPAAFTDLTENEAVTGSYWKQEDGTMEAKSLKIGGKTEAEKAADAARKAKKEAKKATTTPAAEGEASPAPKKE